MAQPGYGESGYHQSSGKKTASRPNKGSDPSDISHLVPSSNSPTGLGYSSGFQPSGQAAAQKAYLEQLQNMLYGSGQQNMGQTGGHTGGGGGGSGDGGPSAYEKWQIAQEEKRQAELQRRKLELTQGLTGARNQALPLLNQYAHQYGVDVNNIYRQNGAQTAGYNNQLNSIAGQITGGAQQQQGLLRNDLAGQGAGGPEMQALQAAGGQNQYGTDFLKLLGQQYNTRLAQAMLSSRADANSMGAAIKASGKSNLEDSYQNQLAQIGMMGLT